MLDTTRRVATPAANLYATPKAAVDDGLAPQFELASRAARLAAAVIDLLLIAGAVAFGGLFGLPGILICLLILGGAGKLALSVRVVRSDGSEADIWRVVGLRWLPRGILACIFSAKRRCAHDFLADTVVVDSK